MSCRSLQETRSLFGATKENRLQIDLPFVFGPHSEKEETVGYIFAIFSS